MTLYFSRSLPIGQVYRMHIQRIYRHHNNMTLIQAAHEPVRIEYRQTTTTTTMALVNELLLATNQSSPVYLQQQNNTNTTTNVRFPLFLALVRTNIY